MPRKGKGNTKPSAVAAKVKPLADIEDVQCCNGQFGFAHEEAEDIRRKLLDWYDRNHRVLPWRHNLHSKLDLGEKSEQTGSPSGIGVRGLKNKRIKIEGNGGKLGRKAKGPGGLKFETEEKLAYAVWVSEIMLQQTRVETVIPYYERWMAKWPSVFDLAQANQEEVNALWAGLGYYRRARFLLEGSKHVVQELGAFPQSASKLQEIPGIGKYTAGAIASIAFKQAVPVVDGNVIRVLCRMRAISSNIKAPTTVNLLWELAGQLVDRNRPGDLNQALMELGATLCTKHTPSCSSCPISTHCKALALVAQQEQLPAQNPRDKPALSVTDFPTKVVKASPRNEYVAVCILEANMNNSSGPLFVLVQRPSVGLLAGLWEFPSAMLAGPDASLETRRAAVDDYLQNSLKIRVGSDCAVKSRTNIGQYTHIFSHIRLHMYIEWLQICCSDLASLLPKIKGEGQITTKWVDAKQLSNMGLTSGVRKVLSSEVSQSS